MPFGTFTVSGAGGKSRFRNTLRLHPGGGPDPKPCTSGAGRAASESLASSRGFGGRKLASTTRRPDAGGKGHLGRPMLTAKPAGRVSAICDQAADRRSLTRRRLTAATTAGGGARSDVGHFSRRGAGNPADPVAAHGLAQCPWIRAPPARVDRESRATALFVAPARHTRNIAFFRCHSAWHQMASHAPILAVG